jgi:hypothetical protein
MNTFISKTFFLTAVAAFIRVYAALLTYSEITGDSISYFTEETTHNESNTTIILKNDKELYTFNTNNSGATISGTILNNKVSSLISIMRNSDNYLKITKDNKTTIKNIDPDPWYISMNQLRSFVKSSETRKGFWIVSADFDEVKSVEKGITAIKFAAIKKGKEDVILQNKIIKAIKITITFTDWKAVFWRSHYWFRLSDGVMIRSEQVRGGPGTPKTIIELTNE